MSNLVYLIILMFVTLQYVPRVYTIVSFDKSLERPEKSLFSTLHHIYSSYLNSFFELWLHFPSRPIIHNWYFTLEVLFWFVLEKNMVWRLSATICRLPNSCNDFGISNEWHCDDWKSLQRILKKNCKISTRHYHTYTLLNTIVLLTISQATT
jgi:hypothetical protein